MTRIAVLAALAAGALVSLGAPAAVAAPPTSFDLPTGYRPEGIALHRGTLLVGSIPTGEIRRIDPRDGSEATVVPPQTGRAAIGLKADAQDRVFVAGGPTGNAFVYDARTGEDLAAFELNPSDDTFINDVVLFGSFAYFTDSRSNVIHEIRRDLTGGVRQITTSIPVPMMGNAANGIAATRDGRYLLVVAGGLLYRVDRFSGATIQVDVDPDATQSGDGLLLVGPNRLLVVQNRRNRVNDLLLSPRFDAARSLRTITSPDFDVPTTVARKGNDLFLPNARFGIPSPETAAFTVTRVPFR